MDGINEKKWFVYITDHHEGPFSHPEIQGKMDRGEISTSHYIWCEGMADWRPMKEVQAFDNLAPAHPAAPSLPQASRLGESSENSSPSIAIAMEAMPAPSHLSSPALAMATASAAATPMPTVSIQAVQAQPQIELIRHQPVSVSKMTLEDRGDESRGGGWFGKAATLIILSALGGTGYWAHQQGHLAPLMDVAQPYLVQLSEKVPALQAYVSPIPKLTDVDPEEFAELRKAAAQPLDRGEAVAIALSRANPEAPEFYVSGNVPDGTIAEISLEGIPDTLLNQLAFTAKLQAVTSKKLGKSQAARFPDGRPMPRGQYKVVVKAGSTNQQKTYFLGGAKDASYTQRLKEFHDRLGEKARNELAELEQFAMTMEAQLTSTVAQFDSARRKKAAGKKEWATHATTWKALGDKLGETFAKWAPETLKTEYFHGALYSELLVAAASVQKVHQFQSAFFADPKIDPKSFDIQLGAAVSGAQSSLASLKSRLAKVKATPPSPNGMPQRESL